MPLFKRRAKPGQQPAKGRSDSRLISEEQILQHLGEELSRARRDGSSLTVLSFVAQLLPGERLRAAETDFASNALVSRLRAHDVGCVLGDGALIAVLQTDADGARVVAHRVAADLAVQSHVGTQRKWLTGTVLFPHGGDSARTLVQAAIDRAR